MSNSINISGNTITDGNIRIVQQGQKDQTNTYRHIENTEKGVNKHVIINPGPNVPTFNTPRGASSGCTSSQEPLKLTEGQREISGRFQDGVLIAGNYSTDCATQFDVPADARVKQVLNTNVGCNTTYNFKK